MIKCNILQLSTFIYICGNIILNIFSCSDGGCPCCKNGDKKLNKYCFLDGFIEIQTVENKKNETKTFAESICKKNKCSMSKYIALTTKCRINNKNKVSFYINFVVISYILDLINNLLSSKEMAKHKSENKKNIDSYINEIDNIITDVFERIVKKGEEIDANDLILKVRNITNKNFNNILNTLDSLTGYETIFS